MSLLLGGLTLLLVGCGQSPVHGTYDVELLIAGASRPLEGTLVLSPSPLDLPARSGDSAGGPEAEIESIWLGADPLAANSCFVLSGRTEEEAGTDLVRVFELRVGPRGVETPLEILRGGELRVEITKIQFFANAVGAEILVHTARDVREGRLQGARIGSPRPQDCLDSIEALRRELLAAPDSDVLR